MSKKLSVTPTLFNPKISSNADAKNASTLLLGLTYSFVISGIGNFLTSIFPFNVQGNSLSCTNTDGTIYFVNVLEMKSFSSSLSISSSEV